MTRLLTVLLVSAFIASAFAAGEITQSRAHQIAAYYFARYFPREGCGGAKLPTLRGDYWESTVGIGEAGTSTRHYPHSSLHRQCFVSRSFLFEAVHFGGEP